MEHVCIWEFEVAADRLSEFIRCYGPEGDWAALFRQAPGYLGTQLLSDQARPTRFLTFDRWRSTEEYEAFRASFRREYELLDRRCESLTTHEASLGSYRLHRQQAA